MKALIALLLLSLSVFAEECDDFRLIDQGILHLGQHFSWNGASTENVSSAPCKTKSLPTNSEMNTVFARTGNSSGEVHGVQLENESPELVRAFSDLMTTKSYFGNRTDPQNQIRVQEQFAVNPVCKKVLCAVEKIWGPSLGRKILYLKLAHGFNASEFSVTGAKRFSEAELSDALLAFGDLPPHLKKISLPNQQFIRVSRDPINPDDTKTQANALVALYDPWSKGSPEKRQYIVFHELSHNISSHLGNLDSSPEWSKLSGWRKLGQEWETDENHCRVSNYGSTHPDEDFAETASAYRYNAHDLKRRCPEKYEWMKARVFDNYEYLDLNCQK